MTSINGPTPFLKVIHSKILDNPKKHVVYTVRVLKEDDGTTESNVDNNAGFVDRRYSEYLELYTKLRQEFPDVFVCYAFPKKAVLGNFSPKTISYRTEAFEALLLLIVDNERVRECSTVIDFFYQKELTKSLKHIKDNNYHEAVEVLENSFHVLNNLLMPRHPRLLQLLCLLVGCCDAAVSQQTKHFAITALQRFEAVSDTDILRYYVPLLQLCMGMLQNGEKKLLQDRLSCMKRRGIKVDGCPSLLEAVMADL